MDVAGEWDSAVSENRSVALLPRSVSPFPMDGRCVTVDPMMVVLPGERTTYSHGVFCSVRLEFPQPSVEIETRIAWIDGATFYEFHRAAILGEVLTAEFSGSDVSLGALAGIDLLRLPLLAHLRENVSCSRLARALRRSPTRLCEKFRDTTGMTMGEYRNAVRLRLASIALLERTRVDLATIALEYGFCDHSHFTSRFSRYFGITPSDFRRCIGTNVEPPHVPNASSPERDYITAQDPNRTAALNHIRTSLPPTDGTYAVSRKKSAG